MNSVAFSRSQLRTAGKPLAPQMQRQRLQCYLLLVASDVIALILAFAFANVVYNGDPVGQHGVVMLTALVPIYLGVAILHRAYAPEALGSARYNVARTLRAFVLSATAIMLIAYLLKTSSEFSRTVFIIGVLFSVLFLPLARMTLLRLFPRILGGAPFSTIVVCDGAPYGGTLPGDIVVTCDELGFDSQTTDPQRFDQFAKQVSGSDRLIVACARDRAADWASVLRSLNVEGEIVSNELDDLGIIAVRKYGQHRTLVVAVGPLALSDRILKRGFDLAFALVALVLASPLLLATAIAIKLDSKGPVIFRQDRIGRGNRIFKVFKFRSMYTELCDDDATKLTTRSDPRVTRVGEFIRRTSIDELPQLVNVLQGDMSIVGPRPHPLAAKAADLLYWDVDPRYRHRHAIKPGLTGLAQVRGFRGNTERAEDLTNRLQADLEYAADWSLWKDVQIIFQTFSVLRHSNAF